MTMNLSAHAVELRDSLAEDTGLAVALDVRDLQVPGVLLTPDEIAFDRLADDTGSMTWRATLVAGYDVITGYDDLGRMLTKLREVCHITDIRAASLSDPAVGSDPLPALTATIRTEWSD